MPRGQHLDERLEDLGSHGLEPRGEQLGHHPAVVAIDDQRRQPVALAVHHPIARSRRYRLAGAARQRSARPTSPDRPVVPPFEQPERDLRGAASTAPDPGTCRAGRRPAPGPALGRTSIVRSGRSRGDLPPSGPRPRRVTRMADRYIPGSLMDPNVAAAIRLMLVTDDSLVGGRELIQLCQSATEGGVTSVELRLKQAPAAELVVLGRRLVAALDVPLLINDRADVAIAAGAAGVHLGPDDMPVHLIRRIAPPGFLIGASVGSAGEVENGLGADYWGVGPWRGTATKADAGPALGPDGFRRIVRMAEGKPCIAIGGVRPDDIPAVVEAGGLGVAVVSGILSGPDPRTAASQYAVQFSRLESRDP